MRRRADPCRFILGVFFSSLGVWTCGISGAVAGCGGSVGTPASSPGDAAATDGGRLGDEGTAPPGDAGIDASIADAPTLDAAVVACPVGPPPEQSGCPRVGMVCEYGSDPRSGCRSHVRCTAGASSPTWISDTSVPCAPIPPGICPATETDAKALATCSPQGLYCNYADDTCICTQCNGPCSPTARFTCYGPPTNPGCPKKKPDIGTSCAGGTHCTYGSCASDITERDCMDGYWVDQPVACAL